MGLEDGWAGVDVQEEGAHGGRERVRREMRPIAREPGVAQRLCAHLFRKYMHVVV